MFHRLMNYGELDSRPSVVLTRELIKKLMPKYKRHDDLIIVQEQAWEDLKKALPLPVVQEENSPFSIDEDELASLVCQVCPKPPCKRLAVEAGLADQDLLAKGDHVIKPNVRLVLGDTGVVLRKENQISYRFDVTKCLFSFNLSLERTRLLEMVNPDEIVVDLSAGFGYFSIPLLIFGKVKHLYACESNSDAVEAFKKNLNLNKVNQGNCTILEGDIRANRPTDVAHCVILAILPSSLEWMQTAFECIDKSTGGRLHCHEIIEFNRPVPVTNETSTNDEKRDSNGFLELPDSCTIPDNTQPSSPAVPTSTPNQSLTSSSSSHSTIEKLSVPSEEKSPSSDSDTNSPVLVERLAGSLTNVSISNSDVTPNSTSNETSSNSSKLDEIITETTSILISEQERRVYEKRGQLLIDQIKDEVEAHNLRAHLVNLQPVRSYSPHIKHIVFDIKIEPSIPLPTKTLLDENIFNRSS